MPSDKPLADCLWNTDGPPWICQQCGWTYARKGEPILTDKPPKRNCPKAPSILEPARKLGIPENKIGRYASMLGQWRAEGCPIRDQEETDWIQQTLCRPCEHFIGGCRFGRCGRGSCKKRTHSVELKYILRMETACCPLYKF